MIPLGTKAPDFTLLDVSGDMVSLSNFSNKKVLVVMFICNHCPYVIHVKEELIRIGHDYENSDVGIVAINSNDPNYDPADDYEHMKEEGYPFPYLFDETQEVAKAYNAACTPDLYVFDEDKKLVYRGQLDDSRPGNLKEVNGIDLRNAIDAVLNDTPIDTNQKPSSGCNIKWK